MKTTFSTKKLIERYQISKPGGPFLPCQPLLRVSTSMTVSYEKMDINIVKNLLTYLLCFCRNSTYYLQN